MKENHKHKWKKVMLTSAPFAEGSYMWWCKKCNSRALTQERPAEESVVEKPRITEEWINKMAWDIWNKNFDARVETYSLTTLEEFLKKKLIEAGVCVA